MTGLRYGRLAARRPVGLADLDAYLVSPLPPPPPSVPAPTAAWGMLGNGPDPSLTVGGGRPLGDCTIAGVVHLRMAVAGRVGATEVFPDSNSVADTYLRLAHGRDTGLVEADVLHTWHVAGLFADRCVGYAPLDWRDATVLRQAVAVFGGVYLGVSMPSSAEAQFAAGEPWTLTGDRRVVGGHCVVAVGYDADWLLVVSWGVTQRVAWDWLAAFGEEGWAVVCSEEPAVDLDVLRADLARI